MKDSSTPPSPPPESNTSTTDTTRKIMNEESFYGTQSIEKEFLQYATDLKSSLFSTFRLQSASIESLIKESELQVLEKDCSCNVRLTLKADYDKLKNALNDTLLARRNRKLTKKESRLNIRQAKKRDLLILQQEKYAQSAFRIRESVNEKRTAFEDLVLNMQDLHSKQQRNLVKSQERKAATERLLVDLESRNLSPELRNTIYKKFQVRQNHQGHLNKRINDNLRELQHLELRQFKELFEFQSSAYESLSTLSINYQMRICDVEIKQYDELWDVKEGLVDEYEVRKEEVLKVENERELKRLVLEQQRVVGEVEKRHKELFEGGADFQKIGLLWDFQSLGDCIGDKNGNVEDQDSGNVCGSAYMDDKEKTASKRLSLTNLSSRLTDIKQCHSFHLLSLKQQFSKELHSAYVSVQTQVSQMIQKHDLAVKQLKYNQERDLQELQKTQERDIVMEESMHDSEMKMLIERRILNSVLETVADGIINITTKGVVVRFNSAAEKIFGYSAKDVIGQNITMLMPHRVALHHRSYVFNYLKTGVKKVIGSGRRVTGKRSDGTEFPLYLSLSELKEDDSHLFTGIVRDLTLEVEAEKSLALKDLQKQNELQALVSKLDIAKSKANHLLCQMLPPSVAEKLLNGHSVPPQEYAEATVMFLDVFGFGGLSEQIPPLEVMGLLNDLYRVIDHVIEKYDVYKVETVGDTYMIVSGVPKENQTHASEVATMALHLLHCIDQFVFELRPEIKIRVRIGVNTGSVVAGVIGSKMPRYCLFGDTVNTASRMVTNGQAGKIHISESTFKKLKEDGGFELSNRGQIEVKGKGQMNTYWVDGKIDFDPSGYK